ncbi:MAG: WhiB family transcriptional regulator [Glycomyces artemisiae]|uniref:WhiB family transcriptional regulator n=1 Tax=Glycomyces artemisiae TaxID=1076443 RepID=A0A850CA34_9ACTN|nr:WhiB family transcriptional regulator [Glycomyces artemisiae]
MTTPAATATSAGLRAQLLDALAAVDPSDQEWRLAAACRDADPRQFHPEWGSGRGDVDRALALCRRCPVKVPCLRVALDNIEDRSDLKDSGVFGGTVPRQRRRMRAAWAARRADATARAATRTAALAMEVMR